MKNHEFDQHIRQQLNSIQPEHEMPSWDSFESRLDREVNDELFDHQIKERIENISQPFQESHWQLFLSRFAIVQLFTKDLIYNKTFECILFFLALAFVFPNQPLPYDAYQIAGKREDGYTQTEPVITLEKESSSNYLYTNTNSAKKADITIQNTGYLSVEETENKLPIFANEPLPARRIDFVKSNHFSESEFFTLLKNTDFYSEKLPLIHSDNLPSAQTLALLPIKNIEEQSCFKLTNFLSKHQMMVTSGINIFISAFTTIDINTIHTPYDAIYFRNGYEQSKMGIGGGISVGWNRNRLTLETGAVYSMKQYSPRSVIEIFRFNPNAETAQAISLKAIELNTLSIPLHIRYDLYQGRKFTPYILGGAAINLATHANYEREQFVFALASPIPSNAQVSTGNTPKLDEKRFTDGLLQGGNLAENYFLSLNSGMGIDYSLNKHWRIFAEATFYYNFLQKELGPNNDRINTFSFKMGGRHVIFKKHPLEINPL